MANLYWVNMGMETGKRVATIRTNNTTGWVADCQHEYGNLIAAAPDLLAAMEALVADCCKPQHAQEISVLDAARAAIAKAKEGC